MANDTLADTMPSLLLLKLGRDLGFARLRGDQSARLILSDQSAEQWQ